MWLVLVSEEDKGKKGGGSGDLKKVEGSDHDQQIYTECFEVSLYRHALHSSLFYFLHAYSILNIDDIPKVKSQLKDSDLLPDLRLASQEPPRRFAAERVFQELVS